MVSYKSAAYKAQEEKSSLGNKLGTTKLGGAMPESESRIRGLKTSVTSARENKMSSSAAKNGAAMAQAMTAGRNRLRRG